MEDQARKQTADHAMRLVDRFFASLSGPDKELVPSVLNSPGTWMASYDEWTLGVFFLDKRQKEIVEERQEREWPPFPGFFISKGNMPDGAKAAFGIEGHHSYLSSNHTSNLFALSVSPGSSCIVMDHFHEIRDSSGEEFKYQVALAFVLGISKAETWADIEVRLSELLKYGMSVWRRLR